MEVSLLQVFLKAWTEVAADLTLEVAGDTFALEPHHSEHAAVVELVVVLLQLPDTANLLAVEALVVLVSGGGVLVGGDDVDHLVPRQLLELQALVSMALGVVPLDPLEVLRAFRTVAAHEAFDGLKRRHFHRTESRYGGLAGLCLSQHLLCSQDICIKIVQEVFTGSDIFRLLFRDNF